MEDQIATLRDLGYEVGVAQDYSDNSEVDFDYVYAIDGFGVQIHVVTESDLQNLIETHEARLDELQNGSERR